jgi:hypothetical protein
MELLGQILMQPISRPGPNSGVKQSAKQRCGCLVPVRLRQALEHMRILVLILLLCLVSTAFAETFEERVELARAAENAAETKPYQKQMFDAIGPHLSTVMKSCFASIKNPETEPFTLVADVTPQGVADAVEVKPNTNIAACFAKGFASANFPPPPQFRGRSRYPMFIDMRIKP